MVYIIGYSISLKPLSRSGLNKSKGFTYTIILIYIVFSFCSNKEQYAKIEPNRLNVN